MALSSRMPGKGSTFRIYLPRHSAASSDGHGEELVTALPRGTETILLAEDERGIRAIATLFLEELGYTVLAASCPDDALRQAAVHRGAVDLLLADVVMPGMNGRQLAERLAAERPAMQFLFISGYTAALIANRGVLDDGVQFLAKPFTREQLAHRVRAVLDGERGGEPGG